MNAYSNMAQYINSNKEFHWGDWYFKDHVMPPDFDYKAHKKELSPYFQERDFKVSMMFADYYSQLNGIHSDRYISMDVYYFYVLPALNRFDFINAYLDKNIYTELFPNVKQPQSVVKNMNGHYSHCGEEIQLLDAVSLIQQYGKEMIIKPTVDTCNGDGVAQIRDLGTDELVALLKQYGHNFIVQEKVKQHPDIQRLNPTSLNSMRLFSYRKLDGTYEFLYPYSFIRYGNKGAIKDNVSQGGAMCRVGADGTVDDRAYRFKSMKVTSLAEETGVENLVIPHFDKVVETLLGMHKRLPYFDLVGWDMTVTADGEPLFIEFNLQPSIEGPQIQAGPMFAEHLDEVIERARQAECSKVQSLKKVFPSDSVFYLHAQ